MKARHAVIFPGAAIVVVAAVVAGGAAMAQDDRPEEGNEGSIEITIVQRDEPPETYAPVDPEGMEFANLPEGWERYTRFVPQEIPVEIPDEEVAQ